MNYLLVNEETLRDFRTLLLPQNKQDARTLFERKQEEFEKLAFDENVQRVTEQLPVDVLATWLIPGEFGDGMFAVKATDNGDCLYNATSIALCGNESLSCLLRLLAAGELFFNADYYAEHPVFKVPLTPKILFALLQNVSDLEMFKTKIKKIHKILTLLWTFSVLVQYRAVRGLGPSQLMTSAGEPGFFFVGGPWC